MSDLIAIAAALLPAFLILWFFLSRDLQPEPRDVLVKTFVYGILIVIPVLLIAIPLSWLTELPSDPDARGLLDAFLCAAIPEELMKYVVLAFFCARHPAFDEPMDGIVYGVTASLGFAAFENVMYVTGAGYEWLDVAWMRALTAVPGHAAMGAVMGYFVARAFFARTRRRWLAFLALALPIALHGLYDFPLLAIDAAITMGIPFPTGKMLIFETIVLGVLILEITLALLMVRKLGWEQRRAMAIPDFTLTPRKWAKRR